MCPAEGVELADVDELAHCAVRLAGVELDCSRKANCLDYQLRQFPDGQFLASTDIDMTIADLTFVGMPLLLHLCKIRGLYDMPNDRKLHSNKIPRLGGVFFAPAMLLGLMAALAYMLWNNGSLPTFGGPQHLAVRL